LFFLHLPLVSADRVHHSKNSSGDLSDSTWAAGNLFGSFGYFGIAKVDTAPTLLPGVDIAIQEMNTVYKNYMT
jgi:hypothetical protein